MSLAACWLALYRQETMPCGKHAQRGGYDTDLLRRVEADDGRLIEQGVDEMLHLKIANALLDSKRPLRAAWGRQVLPFSGAWG